MGERENLYILRRVLDSDLPFLLDLYSTTRQAEMDLVDWTEQEKKDFIEMQFDAQHKHYLEYYANATFEIIESEQTPIGRLYLDRREEEIRIVDIALLPDHCGQGIGSTLLKNIQKDAQKHNLAVRIHVENFNPALFLYERLGFTHVDTNGVYNLMEWIAEK